MFVRAEQQSCDCRRTTAAAKGTESHIHASFLVPDGLITLGTVGGGAGGAGTEAVMELIGEWLSGAR